MNLYRKRNGNFRRRMPTRNRLGVAAVEFAIVAPIFFLMVMGCIEFGRALMVQQILTNASRVGAREASTLTASLSGVVTASQEYASNASVAGVIVTAIPDPASAATGDMIEVTVSVPFSNVSWTPAPWFMPETMLSATSVMRKEGFD